MTETAHVWPDKDPDAELDYAVDFEPECARTWSRWTDYTTGDRIRVYNDKRSSGFEMEATTGGRSGGSIPRFPTALAGTVVDGGVTWTARAVSTASLVRTITGTPVWTADSGLVVENQTIAGMVAIADLSSGVDGTDYAVKVVAETSDGNFIVKRCVLPVRIRVA
jgi:hypothetical protein